MAFIDLSQPLETGMTVFPGDPPVELRPAATVESDGYRVTAISCGSHAGTHIDAPSHTAPAGAALDDFPVGAFVFDVRVIDVRGLADREPIRPTSLPADPAVDMLLFRTGWDAHWNTERYLDHPYLHPAAADRCAERGLSIGIDALNPDPTPSPNAAADEPDGFPAHAAVLGAGQFIVENLTNLDELDAGTLYAFPLSLADGDGAPIRAVAEVRG